MPGQTFRARDRRFFSTAEMRSSVAHRSRSPRMCAFAPHIPATRGWGEAIHASVISQCSLVFTADPLKQSLNQFSAADIALKREVDFATRRMPNVKDEPHD